MIGTLKTLFAWRHGHRDHIRVTLAVGTLSTDNGHSSDPQLFVAATNETTRPVTVSNAWVEREDDPQGPRVFVWSPPPGSTLPGDVGGGGSAETWLSIPDLEARGFDVIERRLVAAVETPAGHVFRSQPRILYGT